MKTRSQKLALTVVGVALSVSIVQPQSADAATMDWGITFFDKSGTQVGTGTFSYDPYITQLVDTSTAPLAPKLNVPTLLSLSLNVLGYGWSNSDADELWWEPSQAFSTKGISLSRYGITVGNQWFLGDPSFGNQSLTIQGGKQPNNAGWGGNWQQQIFRNGGPPTSQSGYGSWTANLLFVASVPESSTTLAVTALGFGYFLLKKLAFR